MSVADEMAPREAPNSTAAANGSNSGSKNVPAPEKFPDPLLMRMAPHLWLQSKREKDDLEDRRWRKFAKYRLGNCFEHMHFFSQAVEGARRALQPGRLHFQGRRSKLENFTKQKLLIENSQHPGGPQWLTNTRGHDITEAFEAAHIFGGTKSIGHSKKALEK